MVYISTIDFSFAKDFFSDPNPITKELHKDEQAQLVYYHFKTKDSLAITAADNNGSLILYVLEGSFVLQSAGAETALAPNDSVLFSGNTDSAVLLANSPGKCLGVSTSPTQHVDSSNELMKMVEAVEAKDVYTHGHSRRVCLYSNAIALDMDVNYDIITLGNAADLHDIGKINVPAEILQKPGKLTPEEYNVIKRHPGDSQRLLASMGERVARAAGQHHERLDGSGYPDGLKAAEICQDARIIAVADVFDALTCKRVYNNPISFEAAVNYLESCNGQYDRDVVATLKGKVLDGTLACREIHECFLD